MYDQSDGPWADRAAPLRDMAAVQKLQEKGSREGDSFDEPENQYSRDRGRHDF
jgi:hypothetical protein